MAAGSAGHLVLKDGQPVPVAGVLIFGNTYYGTVQHLNREPMHQPTRYMHKNGVSQIHSVMIFEDDPYIVRAISERRSRFCICLGETTPSVSASTVDNLSRVTAKDAYGVQIPEKAKNEVGICSHTDDLNLVMSDLEGLMSGIPAYPSWWTWWMR